MVLVTGAAGHLGAALVRELLDRRERVRAFVLPEEDAGSLNGMPIDLVAGNVLDRQALRRAMPGVHTVYHLAGIISILPGRNQPMRRVNVVGTANVARVARESGVRRLVYVSSIHALGRPPRGTPITEQVPFDPHNAAGEYDQSKAEASLAVLAEAARGLDAVIVCPTGIIGPYYHRGGSPMNRQVRSWMNPGLHVTVDGQFDFVDVRDVARAMVLAAEKGRPGQTYILRGERVSVRRLVDLVAEAAGRRSLTLRVPYWLARTAAFFAPLHARLWRRPAAFTRYALETLVSNSQVSGEKAARELGFAPRPMAETIRDTVRWLMENPPQPEAPVGPVRPAAAPSAVPPTRTAVVTGASSGIGVRVARRLAAHGYHVLLVARRCDRLARVRDGIAASGGSAEAVPADLSTPQGVRAVYARVQERGEGLDVLVNSAGFGYYGHASDMPAEMAREMVQVNNGALAELIVRFLPLMRGRGSGHIINVSSIVGGFPSPWAALYSATKSFVDALSTALHRELRHAGIHVSAVRPGPVATEFYAVMAGRSAGRMLAAGRTGIRPEAVADAILGLLRRPRRVVYVPRRFQVLPWVELVFGWLYDRVAGLLLKRQASHA
jgi:dihydroflavonol-4-reductase